MVVDGPWYTSSGGNGIGSTAVGSVEHDELVAWTATARSSSGESRDFVRIRHPNPTLMLDTTKRLRTDVRF